MTVKLEEIFLLLRVGVVLVLFTSGSKNFPVCCIYD